MFVNTLYKNNELSVTPPNQSSIKYNPVNNYPNNFFGMRLGFGSALGKKTPFYYELDYNQTFTKSKINPELNLAINSKSVVGTLGYVLNPESRLRTVIYGGASVIATDLSTTTRLSRAFYSTAATSVDIDPFLGGALIYQINSKFAVRVAEFYDIATYNRSVSGRLVTLLMINYYS